MRRLVCALAVLALACGFRHTRSIAEDDAGQPADPVRGEYLVKAVAGCGECHTPRSRDGKLDMSKWLAGVENRFDLEPDDPAHGAISAPNLTPHDSGLGGWRRAEIRRAILDGIDDHDRPLHPVMPSYVFHNLEPADADAIVAYLLTIPAIDHQVSERQPLSIPLMRAATPVPEARIPRTTLKAKDLNYKRAEHGRYLAAQVGFCMDCHTAWRVDADEPLALDRLFAGGRAFSAAEWVVTDPETPPIVFSYNVTPHGSGIKGWTPEQIATALKKGLDDEDKPLCRPMPSGSNGAHGQLTDADALDIGWYLTTIPPIEGGEIPECTRAAAK